MQRGAQMVVALVVAAAIVGVGAAVALNPSLLKGPSHPANGGLIPVVAAENFWGSLVAQIGGAHVGVLSILTDPNADPHEYSSNTSDAQAVANARLVIVNGAGYDNWATQLVAASATPHQVVLNVADLLGQKAGSNPHFWYSPTYVNTTIQAIYNDLVAIDATDTAYFQQQYATLQLSLGAVDGRIAEIKHQFAGVPVASTESIFVYLANATALNLVSPVDFMTAVSEGTDPPSASVAVFQNQLTSGSVSVLVYNQQTVTPLTQQMQQIAVQHNISIVGVTETIQPPDATFQVWMTSELVALQNGLNQKALGH
jgi:zinc/manganese transport system substrate-binding protein